MIEASGGATKLSNGAKNAKSGFDSLQQGINRLAEGTSKLSSGIAPLTEGEKQLVQSMNQLKNEASSLSSGMGKLQTAQKQLEKGAEDTLEGANKLSKGMDAEGASLSQLDSSVQNLADKLKQYVQGHPDLQKDASMQNIIKQAETLSVEIKAVEGIQKQDSQGIKTLQVGQAQLDAGLKQFGDNLSTAQASGQKLSDGIGQVADGIVKWGTGVDSLSVGINTIDNGSQQLKSGSMTLSNGLDQLVKGSGQLAESLTNAVDQMSDIHQSDKMINMFSRPVQLVESKINAVPNYGTATAPYFLTLGLFVGGLIAANAVPFNRVSERRIPGWSYFVDKLCFYLSLSIIQTLIVDALILFGFRIEILSIPKFLLLSLLASFVFSTFIFMLVSIFGALGRFIAIFFLVLQLVSSGGTFPLVLSLPIIQKVGNYLPMTYAVHGFRIVFNTAEWGQFWQDIAILLTFIIIFIVVVMLLIIKANVNSPSIQDQ
jgi:putative membrane protein